MSVYLFCSVHFVLTCSHLLLLSSLSCPLSFSVSISLYQTHTHTHYLNVIKTCTVVLQWVSRAWMLKFSFSHSKASVRTRASSCAQMHLQQVQKGTHKSLNVAELSALMIKRVKKNKRLNWLCKMAALKAPNLPAPRHLPPSSPPLLPLSFCCCCCSCSHPIDRLHICILCFSLITCTNSNWN